MIARFQGLFHSGPSSLLSVIMGYELASKLWRAAGEAMLVASLTEKHLLRRSPSLSLGNYWNAGQLKVLTPVMQNDDPSGDFFFCV